MLDALAEVARWYRKQPAARSGGVNQDTDSCCPSTKLNRLLSIDIVQGFLRDKVSELRISLQRDREIHALHATIALFLELVDRTDDDVVYHMERAMALAPDEVQYKAHHRRMAFNAASKRAIIEIELKIKNGEIQTIPTKTSIAVRDSSSLTADEFIANYSVERIPVVIRGGASLVTHPLWTLDFLSSHPAVATVQVETKRKVLDSVRWARLEDGPRLSLRDFIAQKASAQLYVHDVSIPLHFPGLAETMNIPAYFAGDFLQLAPQGSLYRETWPSLFLGPASTESQTHIDSFGSNFWMALMEGRKRWLLVHPDDVHLLYPHWHPGSPDLVFSVDLARPDHSLFPLHKYARVSECIMEAGDILFVPAGTPHYVENITDTVAVSSNYIDSSNWPLAREALEQQSFSDPRAAELLAHLEKIVAEGESHASREGLSLSFQEFKNPKKIDRSTKRRRIEDEFAADFDEDPEEDYKNGVASY
ncbi:hypothetical protein LEN26_010978 [Aphanomyces euteiches]|nr:hypothetical protein LEN26_010978 [Aphanomyces euteiches]KAH9126778.1 hypothetical protein AeMF1_002807 [Aphanomyces euteiches]KAH9187164.1 hypothetical protein AeNC1_010858 [Aphanomyces euteiches]